MLKQNSSPLNRRDFLSYIALGTLGLLTKDLINPLSAQADSKGLGNSNSSSETYHIFVPYIIARSGGQQSVTLRSGDDLSVKIPAKIKDGQEMAIKGRGSEGKDITLLLHTLYDKKTKIDDKIYQEIEKNIQFIRPESSQEKCKSVYEQIEDGEYVSDLSALYLLDYAIASSKLDSKIQERYQLASTNSRLVGIQKTIDSTLENFTLSPEEKKLIRATFAYVRADEPVPDFNALTALDTIVADSNLPSEIKGTYQLASATSRALTVDLILVNEISQSPKLTDEQKVNYLLIYEQVRDGKTVEDTETLKALNSFIAQADIPDNAKAVYAIAKEQNLDNQEDLKQKVQVLVQKSEKVKNQVQNAGKIGGAIVPVSTNLLSAGGASAGTGTLISTLSGGAATNATLAALGGGSVAAGGLGMLGGLAVATGGAALIGAAGMLSIALVSKMDGEDQKNLGIAIGTGTITGATSVLAAWTAASALGVAGTLSGAAATTATIAALGGITAITGGAAAVASGTAFLVWSFLKNAKKRDQSVLSEVETRTYTYTEEEIPGDIKQFLQNQVQGKYSFTNAFSAPNIPLDKLSKALEKWLPVNDNEKVIALIDTSAGFYQGGIAFADDRIIWNNNSINYQDLATFVKTEKQLGVLFADKQQQEELSQLSQVIDILSDDNYKSNLRQIQKLVKITDAQPKLGDLVSDQIKKDQLSKLKDALVVLTNNQSIQKFPQLKNVLELWSNNPDLVRFFPEKLVSQLSDEQFKQDLFKMADLVKMLSNESEQDSLTKLLRELGQQYSPG
ncbi:hypothetical protein [Planktothricoides raciborskii]|uniref:Uncharacterized protein n=1 Tax=Planktothricoides raciborskii GIHE-MW2 TaxID=2792601 RepID=A0AAU8JKZ4_9CYAN